MKDNEITAGQPKRFSNRNIMMPLIWSNIVVSALMLLYHLIHIFFPGSILANVLGGIGEVFSFFVFIFVAVSLLILVSKLLTKSGEYLYPYMFAVLVTVVMVFVLPYLID
ncbi:hypothetical protein [Sphingobacterium gobiense]|uniref:Uncharacterized protein n=1 Tax=Sphingobacterium gobiense TaxID=1382456 RepID=A0A2S9JV42_9SPHI|nr:hypothetical protein [Sphingobacterium gobiense]PRD57149.1 hypothetical protein C5749_08080 [Sphingobacterium gobiense]